MKGERQINFVVPLIYVFIDYFLYVPQPGIQPTVLGYQDNALKH